MATPHAPPEHAMYLSALNSITSLDSNLPGTWKLEAGRAITLLPKQDAQLCISHGRVWLTFDCLHNEPAQDLFLQTGQQLHVSRGQRVVLESYGSDDLHAPAYFNWCAVAATVTPPVRTVSPWQLRVAAPLADLRGAAWAGVGAASRLGLGLILTAAWSATYFIAARAGYSRAATEFDAKRRSSCTP